MSGTGLLVVALATISGLCVGFGAGVLFWEDQTVAKREQDLAKRREQK